MGTLFRKYVLYEWIETKDDPCYSHLIYTKLIFAYRNLRVAIFDFRCDMIRLQPISDMP